MTNLSGRRTRKAGSISGSGVCAVYRTHLLPELDGDAYDVVIVSIVVFVLLHLLETILRGLY